MTATCRATHPSAPTAPPCPGCGAPVEFRSAQSTLRGLQLLPQHGRARRRRRCARIGKMAELFDDHSPLQLGAPAASRAGLHAGRPAAVPLRRAAPGPNGRAVRRRQRSGVLGEDNGAYVFALPAPLSARAAAGRRSCASARPPPSTARPSASPPTSRSRWSRRRASCRSCRRWASPSRWWSCAAPTARCSASTTAREPPGADARPLGAARGPAADRPARGQREGGKGPPVQLPELRRAGRGQAGRQQERSPAAPCNSLIDLTQGIGGELRHAAQDEPVQPLIPLGSIGQLQGVAVAGGRLPAPHGPEPGDDEHFGWSEYLLYNRKRGFIFLVDAEDGWSVVKPTTGAPDAVAEAAAGAATWARPTSCSTATTPRPATWPASSTGRSSAARRPSTATSPTATRLLSMERLGQRSDLVQPAAGSTATPWPKAFRLERKKDAVQAQRRAADERGVGRHGLRHDHRADRRAS